MKKSAFTLIEMLVVMGILLLLGAILLPITNSAIERGRATKCLGNLRAMGQAVILYATTNGGRFPPALVSVAGEEQGWDFFIRGSGEDAEVEPGWIWRDYGVNNILQCPSYRGPDNWRGERHTGYNYNSSFLGGMRLEMRGRVVRDIPSATYSELRNPADTAVFGDGEYANGANKFMRSPLPGTLDADFSGREAGTQGFRHQGKTHIAFADGHVGALRPPKGSPRIGFLSVDNAMYDLE